MIERTKNYRRVKRLVPDWQIIPSSKVYYLIEVIDGEDVGGAYFHPCEKDGLMVHISFKDSHRGKLAAKSVKAAFQWLFDNTEHDKIVALIPVAYRKVHFMARHVGMSWNGIEENLFRCYSVSRYKFEHQKRAA